MELCGGLWRFGEVSRCREYMEKLKGVHQMFKRYLAVPYFIV